MIDWALVAPLMLAAPQQAAPDTAQPMEKMICRRVAKTQSRIAPPRVCKTQAQWDAEARDQAEGLDRTRNRNQNPGN